MKIQIEKERMENLYNCLEKNIGFISTAVKYCTNDKNIIDSFEKRLSEIQYYLNQAYNPELLKLKQQAKLFYQKWLSLKKTDPVTAAAVYLEYLDTKHKIEDIEDPF